MQVLDQTKLAVALRTARAAVGWSQEELAGHLGMAKTTIARMETVEGGLRADQLAAIVRLYKSVGVEIEFMYEDEVVVRIDAKGLVEAQRRLLDQNLRRADKKKPAGGLLSTSSDDVQPGIATPGGGLLSTAKRASDK
jgi:transcriptional regulator with XRE-family HTH domain